jgi:hypothetical protein
MSVSIVDGHLRRVAGNLIGFFGGSEDKVEVIHHYANVVIEQGRASFTHAAPDLPIEHSADHYGQQKSPDESVLLTPNVSEIELAVRSFLTFTQARSMPRYRTTGGEYCFLFFFFVLQRDGYS